MTDQEDAQHLDLLSIFHYVLAGITALFACFPIFHLALGVMMMVAPASFGNGGAPAPVGALFGLFFTLIPAAMILGGWALAVALFLAGHYLKRRERYTYCLVVAAISCAFMPIGTVLGVFTIIVLMRPSVKTLFGVATPQE